MLLPYNRRGAIYITDECYITDKVLCCDTVDKGLLTASLSSSQNLIEDEDGFRSVDYKVFLYSVLLQSGRGGQTDDFRPLTYTLGGGGAWGAGTNSDIITQASYESLPAPMATQIPTLWMHTSGGGGGGGSDNRSMSSI